MSRTLLTDPDDWMSSNGGAVLGATANINHSLGFSAAQAGSAAIAKSRAQQYQNDAYKEMAKNKMPPSAGAQQSPWLGVAQQGLGLASQIFKAGAPGTNAVDTTGPMWSDSQNAFNDYFKADQAASSFGSFPMGASNTFGVDVSTSGIDFGSIW